MFAGVLDNFDLAVVFFFAVALTTVLDFGRVADDLFGFAFVGAVRWSEAGATPFSRFSDAFVVPGVDLELEELRAFAIR